MSSNEDDGYYEIAGQEIATKELVPAIWTKAFAYANGNTTTAFSMYIKFRVEQLKNTEMERRARNRKLFLQRKLGEGKEKVLDASYRIFQLFSLCLLTILIVYFILTFLLRL
ncbi:hypothetical protein KIH39_15430 [Telmatocola sphagniphila]|uniref:Uncharacterized protein n=1 Tax=Telmatocola sphagniphila TaxID=1123043 RepID=A0A8E6ES67_9BACT|nr:hypothetical protein [Telmatocola sphagniphila]QVL30244.1 hypothetical protein KIH39_15430 [Telmatocola sphagniphila]